MYLDDILITLIDHGAIKEILAQLNKKFTMKHLGEANEFLGIKIDYDKQQYFFHN